MVPLVRAWSRSFGHGPVHSGMVPLVRAWSRPFGGWARSFGHGPVHSGMVPSIRWMVPLIRAWSRSFGHGPVHSAMVPFILHGPAIIEQSRIPVFFFFLFYFLSLSCFLYNPAFTIISFLCVRVFLRLRNSSFSDRSPYFGSQISFVYGLILFAQEGEEKR
ncbi:hypothetical protein B9Z55_005500 [Caenorhabditis nigoni]|uniref:Uncharacterized protein n=1 Tax=Caenorhabditis nigoni TaxID=1611254 RepID=A0A2G5V1W4_9PELO|nr:hypothetical protein B9Z55_005500 [Caenorhabditis nigoni]